MIQLFFIRMKMLRRKKNQAAKVKAKVRGPALKAIAMKMQISLDHHQDPVHQALAIKEFPPAMTIATLCRK